MMSKDTLPVTADPFHPQVDMLTFFVWSNSRIGMKTHVTLGLVTTNSLSAFGQPLGQRRQVHTGEET